MTGFEFVAAIVNSLAWPVAAIVAVIVLRPELAGVFRRIRSFELLGGKATFQALESLENAIAVAKDEPAHNGEASSGRADDEFTGLEIMAATAPAQAVMAAWEMVEYELDLVSSRIAPDQPCGWPLVARNLQALDKWPVLYPVILELRRLRDYTADSSKPPSSADAARYVSVARDLVTTVRSAKPRDVRGRA